MLISFATKSGATKPGEWGGPKLNFDQHVNNEVWVNMYSGSLDRLKCCWYKPKEDEIGRNFETFMKELLGFYQINIPLNFVDYCLYFSLKGKFKCHSVDINCLLNMCK